VVSSEATRPGRDRPTPRTSTAPAGASPTADGPPTEVSGRTWFATIILLLAALIELMNVTMATVAIPSIQSDLGATYGQTQWVVASYALAFAVALMTGGRFGDIWGRKRIFVIGIAGFMLTSLLGGVAQDPNLLIGARVLQGLTAALMLPQVLASMNVWFPPDKRAAAFGLFGAVSGIGALAAPLVGGSLLSSNPFGLEWRSVFLINIPLGLITLVGAIIYVDESKSPHPLKLDLVGVLISATAVSLLVFPIIQGRDADWAPWVWVTLALSVPAFALLVVVERAKARADGSPLIDLDLFRRRGFGAGLLTTVVFFAGVTSVGFVLMIFLQSGFGYSPFRSGLSIVPFAVGMIVGSGISITASQKIGRPFLQLGSVVATAGTLWLVYILNSQGSDLTIWNMVPALAVMGLGLGLVVAPLADFVLAEVPPGSAGSASGLQTTMIQVGSAIGVALLGVIFFGLIASSADDATAKVTPGLHSTLVTQGIPSEAATGITDGLRTCFHDRTHGKDPTVTPPSCQQAGAISPDVAKKIEPSILAASNTALRDDFSYSLQQTLYWVAGFFALTFFLVFFMPQRARTQEQAFADA
jgi:EmrB/QacA subfamily drug resistance transporter